MIRPDCVTPAGVTCNDLPNTQMSKVRESGVDQLGHEMVKQRRRRRKRRGCFTITSIMSDCRLHRMRLQSARFIWLAQGCPPALSKSMCWIPLLTCFSLLFLD
jgi:hypothetical protein